MITLTRGRGVELFDDARPARCGLEGAGIVVSDKPRRLHADEFERILTACPEVLYTLAVAGEDMVPTWVSDNIFQLIGPATDDFVGNIRWWRTHLHPDDRDAAMEGERRLLTEGHVVLEYRFRRPDGTYLWIRDDMNLVADVAGGPAEVVGSLSDITARKQAEESARDSEAQAQAIIENMSDTFYRADREGRVVMASRAATDLLGYTTDELIGKEIAGLYVDPGGRDAFLHLFYEAGGDITNYEMAILRKDGGVVWVSSNARYWRSATGDILGIEGTLRDVTGRRRLEERLRQSQKMEALGQLTAGVAHEFNNILTAIINSLALIDRGVESNSEAHKLLEIAQASAWRGADITSKLLAFGRRQLLRRELLDLNEVVGAFRDVLISTLGDSVEIETNMRPGLTPAMMDRAQVQNALLNLALNARDSMPGGGRLTIETGTARLDQAAAAAHPGAAPGDYLVMSVTDSGAGMTAEEAAHAFEPFYTTKPVGQGTGLGLSMVHGFAEQSGGFVTLESEPGQGTRVELHLPTATGAETAAEA